MAKFAVILLAAGQSRRFQDKNYKKPFAPLAGRAVWLHSAERFAGRSDVKQILVTVAGEDREEFDRKFGANVAILGLDIVEGGAERADSIAAALDRLTEEIEFVAVHDTARPCLVDKWIDQVFEVARRDGAAILATPITSTIKQVEQGNQITKTVDRQQLWAAQTPQVFRRELLLEAYANRGDVRATDDAQLVECLGHRVSVVEGSPLNWKITTRADLRLVEQLLKVLPRPKPKGGGNPFAADDLWR